MWGRRQVHGWKGDWCPVGGQRRRICLAWLGLLVLSGMPSSSVAQVVPAPAAVYFLPASGTAGTMVRAPTAAKTPGLGSAPSLLFTTWLGANFYVLYTRPPVTMTRRPLALQWTVTQPSTYWRPVQTYLEVAPCLADMDAQRTVESWTTTSAGGAVTMVVAQYVCLRNDLDPNRLGSRSLHHDRHR